MSDFGYTYTIERPPAPEESWRSYVARTEAELLQLMSADADEAAFQSFLERNPAYVPGAFGISLTSGHAPLYGSVITQPQLPGFAAKRPDFMWLATNSEEVNPILIEIERPSKPWYTRSGQATSEFTHAYNQLIEWRDWFSHPENVTVFRNGYNIDSQTLPGKHIRPHYVLVYGRRDSIAPQFRNRRSAARREDEAVMTFDRLSAAPDQDNFLCIAQRNDEMMALTFPSTARIGPNIIGFWSSITNVKDCIAANSNIAPERREFLAGRYDYWQEWYESSRGGGTINSGDWE